MTTSETGRLAALERTLVGAAAQQAERRRGRDGARSCSRRWRRRSSSSPQARWLPRGCSEASILASQPCAQSTSPWLPGSRRARSRATSRAIACRLSPPRVVASASCSVHSRAGLQPGMLTADAPVGLATDYGPGSFRVYGLAADDVTAVSVRARGVTRRRDGAQRVLSPGRFPRRQGPIERYIDRPMRDGPTRHVPFAVDRYNLPRVLPSLPGFAPAANTAA